MLGKPFTLSLAFICLLVPLVCFAQPTIDVDYILDPDDQEHVLGAPVTIWADADIDSAAGNSRYDYKIQLTVFKYDPVADTYSPVSLIPNWDNPLPNIDTIAGGQSGYVRESAILPPVFGVEGEYLMVLDISYRSPGPFPGPWHHVESEESTFFVD